MNASSADPARGAIEIVTSFLRLVEQRRLDDASRYLAPSVEITFPGGRRFADLNEQVDAANSRYRKVRKVFDGFDVLEEDGVVIVYVFGDLEGENLAGERFTSVRFIDRFELVHGLIATHQVWNDLGADAGHDG
ncbi:MAG: nuclear transport factor 2 family protein [Acidimicrobiia bacterium]|nr:MAG: nuclear transport factor 2 family protein [Acidimicrobiia bacterium]